MENGNDFKKQMTEARRTQILLGAAQAFAEKGFHKATTREIAKAAGVSEGTIYNYFDTKRDLLVALIDLLATQSFKNLIMNDPPDDPEALLTILFQDRYQLAQDRGQLIVPVIAEVFTDVELRELLYQQVVIPMTRHMERYIQAHIDSGQFRQIDPVIVTRALMGALMLNIVLKLTHLDTRYEAVSEEALIEQLISLVLNGLLVKSTSET